MSNVTTQQPIVWDIVVLRFSASLISNAEGISQAIHEIYQYLRDGFRILAVVSTMDKILEKASYTAIIEANETNTIPPLQEFVELLATEEIASACLFTIHLDKVGIKAKKLHQQCLLTKNSPLNAEPALLTTDVIQSLFTRYSVLVMPGAIGHDQTKKITLLGQHGADFSAFFAAWSLNAKQCILYKTNEDYVKALSNPSNETEYYKTIGYSDLLKLPTPIIQHQALKFAESISLPFVIKPLAKSSLTTVGIQASHFSQHQPPELPLTITLLGLNTHSFTLYKQLVNNSPDFKIQSLTVSPYLRPYEYEQIIKEHLADKTEDALKQPGDIALILLEDTAEAFTAIKRAMTQGCHVITSNKHVLTEQSDLLHHLAEKYQIKLLYSACVDSSIPILKFLSELRETPTENPIQSIIGLLNNSYNWVLDNVRKGQSLHNSMNIAKRFNRSLSSFSQDKQQAILLCRAAFGRAPDNIEVQGLQDLNEQQILEAAKTGHIFRFSLCCVVKNQQIRVNIKPLLLEVNHPLAKIANDHHALLIHTKNHQVLELHGKRLNRESFAEVIFGDLMSLAIQLRGLGWHKDKPTFQHRTLLSSIKPLTETI